MGKKLVVAAIALAILILFVFAFSRQDLSNASSSTSTSIWKQMKRRLLDDDVPQQKPKPNRQFDMTNI